MERILIIEDELPLARFLELELQYEGYEVDTANDGRAGLQLALERDYTIILLDIMLPGFSGVEVCRRLRLSKTTPILMLTARSSIMDRVSGLDSGADDYIVKPFAIEELLARIRVAVRRMRQHKENVLRIADLVIDPERRSVERSEKKIELTVREFDLLTCLAERSPSVVGRDILLQQVWGYSFFGETNVVDVYIRYLRSKIDEPFTSKLIYTVRGVGYALKGD